MTYHTKKNNGNNSIIKAGMLFGILALLVLGCQRQQNWAKGNNTQAAPSLQSYDLEAVRTPQGLRTEMLDYPGFTVSFNPDFGQPNYVVWELTREESQSANVKRTNNFMPDTRVEGCATLADYQNSGYDRGHMAPSGDMKWSKDAMDACFLLTNMSPQDHTLNTGAWNKLEIKCREWAQRDGAVVIVCGPVLTDEITRYIGPNRIPVPERYFKVILSPYSDPPRGIGFIMPNGPVPGGMQASAVSIDEVEAITGYDFFYNLPDDIEDEIEAECNFARWTHKQRHK